MMHDLSSTLALICHDLNVLYAIQKRPENSAHIGIAKSPLRQDDHPSIGCFGFSSHEQRMSQHEKIRVADIMSRGHVAIERTVALLREMSPAFDIPYLPVAVTVARPSKRHPRLCLRLFGREVGTSDNPIELPKVLATLDAALSRLAPVKPGGARQFQVASHGTMISAHSPEDALRIHAALSMPRLFEATMPAPKILESLDAAAALACLTETT